MPRAERDLFGIYEWIGAGSSNTARKWYLGLKEAIRSLRVSPARSAVTPEDNRLRHLLYGRKPHVYRVIFRILDKEHVVEVLHIGHGARAEFLPERIYS